MKVSLRWLSEYVDIGVSVEEVVEKLTMAGVEVGKTQIIGGDWEGIVVGKIVSVDAHPNADRLRLVTVDLGKQQATVVCGAPNLSAGDKVAFAHTGARLVDAHTSQVIELKAASIRGVVSEGMVCSEKELGVSDRHEGIMVLSPEATVGTALSEYLGDTILDLDVTPNRPDCLSVIGTAREVAALTGGKLHIPEVHYDDSGSNIDSFAHVEIAEPDLCPRYCASLLTGVRVTSSPQWLQHRLLTCGMRPINSIVDITNYVMLEYGQPLHPFDYDAIRGKQIIVRPAEMGESIATLDGAERTLGQDILAIADKERAIAIGGIMGGLDTEVTSDTSTILLESANFNQAVIHRGRTSLRLSTEASLRFEKGLSLDLPLVALKRATQLMVELTGCQAARGLIDAYPGKRPRKAIMLPASEVKRLLGIEVEVSNITGTLKLLGFSCEQTESPSQVRVHVPWWRTDVSCVADVVEEVARIIGYDNIPATMLSAPLPEHVPVSILALRPELRSMLVCCGFQEILTYSLSSLERMSKLSPELCLKGPTPARVGNPMSRDQEYLRSSLRDGVLTVLARNERHGENGIRLFEIGKVFLPREKNLPSEKEMLCGVVGSSWRGLFWRDKAEPADFFVAKGIVETVLSRLGLVCRFEGSEDESLCPGRTAAIIAGGDKIGVVGELHPGVTAAFELSDTAYLIEIDLEKLSHITAGTARSSHYRPISRYPGITRDIALMVDEQITYERVHALIRDFSLVEDAALFDLYGGERVPKGEKSFAFRVVYRSSTHTLTDEEADEVQRELLDRLARELGAALRA